MPSGFDNLEQKRGLARFAESGVEIHDVQPARSLGHERRGLRGGVVRVDFRGAPVTLLQPHDASPEQIDGGIDDRIHAASSRSRRKRARRSSPSRALFSGWNCTPCTLPLATTAAMRTPQWSATARVTSAGASHR